VSEDDCAAGGKRADDPDDRDAPSESDPGSPRRGLDTILGAASLAAKTTGGVISGGEWVANVVARSPVGRLASRVTRRVTEPLAREGAEVRERLVDEVPDAIQEASARVVPAVVETIDPDVLLDAIDLNAVVGRIDLNGLLAQVDLDALLERVDLDALLGRIDLDALLARVDLNALVAQVDVDALVGRSELGGIIAKSTAGLASETIDAARRQAVGLDAFVARWFDRTFRRRRDGAAPGPPLLVPGVAGELGSGAR
jgi:hypothetical protein